jgi:hypothetical protein
MNDYLSHRATMTTLAPRASRIIHCLAVSIFREGSRAGIGRTAEITKVLVGKPGLALCLGALVFTLAACGSSTVEGPHPTPSSGGPAGLPANWQALAIRAAKDALNACAQSSSLNQTGCPQSSAGPPFGQVAGLGLSNPIAHWTVIGEPLAHAVATIVPELQTPSYFHTPSGSANPPPVRVSGLFQMQVAYTVQGQGIRPYLDYSGGRADATMSWDGSSFQQVKFGATYTVGPTLPPFTRPAGATEAAALSAVKSGFQECVTIPAPPTFPSIPNCPQQHSTDPYATSAQWVLDGDPMQGALVSFDPKSGDLTVGGNYAMKLTYQVNLPGDPGYGYNGTHGAAASGGYSAVLAWDGNKLQLLKITPTG